MQIYFDNSEYLQFHKFKLTLRRFVFLLLLKVLLFLVFLLYLYMKHNSIEIQSILIALANSFGLFLIIIILGYSLVNFPKKLLEKRLTPHMIQSKINKLGEIQEKMTNAVVILEYNYKIIFYLNKNVGDYQSQEIIIKRTFANFNNLIIEDFGEMIDGSMDEEFVRTYISKINNRKIQKICNETMDLNIKYIIWKN